VPVPIDALYARGLVSDDALQRIADVKNQPGFPPRIGPDVGMGGSTMGGASGARRIAPDYGAQRRTVNPETLREMEAARTPEERATAAKSDQMRQRINAMTPDERSARVDELTGQIRDAMTNGDTALQRELAGERMMIEMMQ
jgi:hypothetical protein